MNTPELSLIMTDKIDWDGLLGPVFVVGKNKKPIRVYLGYGSSNIDENNQKNMIGIYVNGKDYDKIDHTKIYVFIHDYEYTDEMLEQAELLMEQNEHVGPVDILGRIHVHFDIYPLGVFKK